MAFKLVIGLAVMHVIAATPALTLEDLEMADDTMSVGSYIRETRAAAPENYHKSYENEGDGEIGYSRKKTGGGKKGYQHFDSYHKKAGDNYEFEKQDSYGEDEEGQSGAHSHNHERTDKSERLREPESEDIDEGEHDSLKKEKKNHHHGRHHEELKEGASDGNGGTEEFGHDPADYILPEKYTFGNGDEYNF